MFDVVSFGSAVVDVFINTEVAKRGRFISYPVGSKILVDDLKFDIGGGGTNTSVAFSRLGLKTGCICAIGGEILKLLKKEKVIFLGKESRIGNAYSFILDSKDKSRTILTYKGNNDKISLRDIKKFKTKWLYLSSMLGESFNTQKKLALKLKKKGTKIAFNPSEYLIKRKNLTPLLKISDILIVNKEEARMIVGKKEKNLLKGLQKITGGIVVITDKNNLITCFDGHGKYILRPNKINVVERTGAGDAFASGFVAGQIVGKPIRECLRLGLQESENVIKHFGAKNRLIKMRLKRN